MKPKAILKLVIDLGMTILLILLMSFERIGRSTHEWIGIGIFVLFILHHALNRAWLRNLAKGKYTPLRVFQICAAALVFLCMMGAMASAVILSREVLNFRFFRKWTFFARLLHMLSAYWGFLFMGIHLGLHWDSAAAMIRKAAGIKTVSAVRVWFGRVLVWGVSGFGVFAFLKNHIAEYLFLCSHFVFFDWEQPAVLFFAEYVSMLVLWICVGHYAAKGLRKRK